jgi:hypothetical protein
MKRFSKGNSKVYQDQERNSGEKREKEAFPVPKAGNRSKDSKWWSPVPSFILKSWGNAHG